MPWFDSPWFSPLGLLSMVLVFLAIFHPALAFAADAVAAVPIAAQDIAGKVLDFSQISITGLGGQSVGIFTALEDGVMPYLVGNLAWLRPIMPLAVSFIMWLAGGIHDGASWGTILKGTLGTGLGSMILHNVLNNLGGVPAFFGGLVLQVLTKGSAGSAGPISPDTYKALVAKGQDVSAWNPDGSLKTALVPAAAPALAPVATGWPAKKGMPEV